MFDTGSLSGVFKLYYIFKLIFTLRAASAVVSLIGSLVEIVSVVVEKIPAAEPIQRVKILVCELAVVDVPLTQRL